MTDFDDRLKEMDERLKVEPENGNLWMEKGNILNQAERFDEAIDAYSVAVTYMPFYSRLRLSRGRRYISAARYCEAFAELSFATRLDPADCENWYYLGVAYCLNGRYEQSLATFKRCLEVALCNDTDEIPPVVDWLYTVNMKLNRGEDAEDVLKYVNEDTRYKPNEFSYKKRVLLYKGLIKPEELINEEQLNNSDRPKLYFISEAYALANYYYRKGDVEKSDDLLRRIRAVDKYHHAFAYTLTMQDIKRRGIK